MYQLLLDICHGMSDTVYVICLTLVMPSVRHRLCHLPDTGYAICHTGYVTFWHWLWNALSSDTGYVTFWHWLCHLSDTGCALCHTGYTTFYHWLCHLSDTGYETCCVIWHWLCHLSGTLSLVICQIFNKASRQ